MFRYFAALLVFAVLQQPQIGIPHVGLGDGPFIIDTAEQHKIRVVVVTKGLQHPWSLAFMPDGGMSGANASPIGRSHQGMLVTERPGRLRIIRDGVLDPKPLSGMPKVYVYRNAGLYDVTLHPRFSENKLVYFTYSKPGENGQQKLFPSLKRRGGCEDEVRADGVVSSTKCAGGRDHPGASRHPSFARRGMAQDTNSDYGKVLRLKDDGSVPNDNPFVGRAGYKPEIYSLGHRDQLGLTIHPDTGMLFSNENGPNGGDEINVILPGRNYGWPVVSYGRTYEGPKVSETPWREDFEQPLVFWVPSIALSGMAVYTGNRFPAWKGNIFVGGMRYGEIPPSGRLERVVFNDKMEELRRESLLTELRQRIRDVRQGPDGLLYLLTEEEDGALLRIEPAP